MCTAGKLALHQVGFELTECILQIFSQDKIHLLGVERGKARRVGNISAVIRNKFDVTGRVTATADTIRNRTGFGSKVRNQSVEQAGLANAGITGEGSRLAAQESAQFLYALPCCGT